MLAAILKTLRTLARDEAGAAVSEYALVIGGMIVIIAIVLSVFGTKILSRWEQVADKLDGKTSSTVHVAPDHTK